ncbi:MAG: hypothetical protein GXP41_02710 [Chloroflexi bacterium]|nr:hypothetical protein [Chloroflexota bacterium]
MRSEPTQPTILLYGDSLALAAVESRLRSDPRLRVIHIDPAHATAMEQLAALGESTLVYDCRAIEPDVISAIHVLHPRIPTVGLGGGDGRGLTLLGKTYSQQALAGLGVVLWALRERET